VTERYLTCLSVAGYDLAVTHVTSKGRYDVVNWKSPHVKCWNSTMASMRARERIRKAFGNYIADQLRVECYND